MSSNVSVFEKLYREAVCQPKNSILLSQMLVLPENEKPLFFRNKNLAFIQQSIANLRNLISQICGVNTIALSTNNNNKIGNDIEETTTSYSFEIKLGGMTDANLGIGIMEWSLEFHNGEIKKIMDSMLVRRSLFLDGKEKALIITSREASKKDMERLFLSSLSVGSKAPSKLSHTAKAISMGITKQKEIQDLYNTPKKTNNVYLLILEESGTFRKSDKSFESHEDLIVYKVGVGAQGGGAQIHLKGSVSGQTIEFRQHYKNSHTDKETGKKIPAEFWVETPCFNVWVGK